MKVIDLLNKIANGEEVPKKIRIDHWCYKFEWVEHDSNYYDKHEDIDLMSCLSMDKEELNYEVKIIEEDKKIGKLKYSICGDLAEVPDNQKLMDKINEIIEVLNNKN